MTKKIREAHMTQAEANNAAIVEGKQYREVLVLQHENRQDVDIER